MKYEIILFIFLLVFCLFSFTFPYINRVLRQCLPHTPVKTNEESNRVCLVVLSTDKRPKMIYQTIQSFLKYNNFPLHQKILVSDSDTNITYLDPLRHNPEWNVVLSHISFSAKRYDRYFSLLDHTYHRRLSKQCSWVFFMEDDWLWHRPGYIRHSMAILNANHNISVVAPKIWKWDKKKGIQQTNNISWVWSMFSSGYGGFTFWPHLMHLRRTYYGTLNGKFSSFRNEKTLSRTMQKRGFMTAYMYEEYAQHTGGKNSW